MSIFRAAALVATLAFALLLFAAAQASAAMVFQNDEDGANDQPGQKDLTRHGIDAAGLPTSLQVSWSWDTTGLSGANTGDGCALFDTDDDGRVNFALCVTIEDDPAVQADTRLYSCGDDKVDRCTSPVDEIPAFSSGCSTSQTATDPFPSGESNPNDTTALCSVAMLDFGATSAKLVNTCSYPSQEPNSDPSDCVLVPRDGFLIINKVAQPDDSSAEFDFALDGGSPAVFTAHGSETSGVIPVRTDMTHSLAETMPALWSLDSASCSDNSGTLAATTLSGVAVAADETVTCTFNNSFDAAAPSISTEASATVDVGGTISDTATLSGGYNPEGTITFNLYGPDDATCSTSIYETTTAVTGNGSYVADAYTATAAGTYRWIASYSGDANNDPATGACNDANESVVVDKAAPSISTQASDPVVVGNEIHDTATLSGGYNPTGTITFNLYGPDDATCATSIYETSETVDGNGDYAADAYTATAAGTYRWIASYSGDANNDPATGACNDADESVVVGPAGPAISTKASGTVVVGSEIYDTATLSGGHNPTGTITFNLYGPDDATCETSIYETSETVDGNGDYAADAYTATAAGTYRWIASYSGDANNDPVSGSCNDADESVVVDKASPSISTQASGAIDLGGNISDTATLSGGYNPTGTITFNLYGPNDAQCTTSIDEESVPVDGNGDYPSPAFTPTAAGTYRWIASYSGDANNAAASGACNDEGESVVVSRPSISLEKTVSATPVSPGTTVVFTLTVTNDGDIDLVNVDLNDDTCSPLVLDSGDEAPLGVLSPGESWVYTCSKTIDANTVNVATVDAVSLNQTPVTDTASATVAVVVPVVAQAAPQPAVALAKGNACESKRFRIRPKISGGTPTVSVLRVDGRRKATSRSKSPSFLVDARKYRAGSHRVSVSVTLDNGQKIVVNGSFKRCKIRVSQRRIAPGFTG